MKVAVGSELPRIQGLTFVKGEPVDGIGAGPSDRVLVLEFWATWSVH